jgi:hypothetical protein
MAIEAIRKMVPLSPDEVAELDAARTEGTMEHTSLTELAGTGADRSEAATLHALVALGLRTVHARALEHGYAALAASQDDEDDAYRSAMRGRRRGAAED